MKIAIAGSGYVGLVTAACMADKGHQVVCVDVDDKRVEVLKKGICPIFEPGLGELIKKNKERLSFTTNWHSAYRDAKVIFIGVGTPEKRMALQTFHMFIQSQNRLLNLLKQSV